jgi:hypothetical protein
LPSLSADQKWSIRWYVPEYSLLAALSIQGCGNGQEEPATQAASPAAQTAIEPCDLITRDEAAQLLGEPVLEGERREEGRVGMTLCLYNPADPDSSSPVRPA